MMKFYSLNKQSPLVDFREATIRGQAPDKGLYFPEKIPQLKKEWIGDIGQLTNEEIAFEVIKPFVGKSIPEKKLFQIVKETINFDIPLVPVSDHIYSLELFHGPTLAFKDIGARFMSRCLGHFVEQGISGLKKSGRITVLVATSGDTGGAVASGFYDVEGVDVVILYPSGKVSPVQEKQLTTLGKNIHAIEIKGTFDDCQSMVKHSFTDKDISEKIFLTSANSINVARWLPQQFYYFFAYKLWPFKEAPVISVPSGNFGNICAGILAMRSGLPVSHFIAACNANDVVTRYLEGSAFLPKPAIATLSNAMDVGDPSNFIRVLELFHHQFPELKSLLSSFRISDEETLDTIRTVFEEHKYLLDPHGAVGYLALFRYLQTHPGTKGIFLETAHPVKFPDAVLKATGKPVDVPGSIRAIMDKEKNSILMEPHYDSLKDFLISTW
jgi:threonine synthase